VPPVWLCTSIRDLSCPTRRSFCWDRESRPASSGWTRPASWRIQAEGYFVQPTIVRDIPDDARLVREEQFGPVLPVLRFTDVDDVVARANDTDFGLGGSVWSSDREGAFRVATRINSGMVWVNKHLDVGPDTPFAGAKQSGIGVEMGQEGLEEFTQATVINMAK
jgi:acyl-CoA reductase-like NAD-dependent aldehyde dehydrogenase